MGDVLSSLGRVHVTLSVLRESKVGATVSKLKKHANEGISSSAKALVKKWKKIAEESGVAGGAAASAAASIAASGKSDKPSSGSAGKGELRSVEREMTTRGLQRSCWSVLPLPRCLFTCHVRNSDSMPCPAVGDESHTNLPYLVCGNNWR